MVGSLPAALAIASHPRGTVFFSKGAAASVFCRGVRFSLPALASCGRIFRSSLTAPLLYRIKMEFLCEVFEQIENKKSAAPGKAKTGAADLEGGKRIGSENIQTLIRGCRPRTGAQAKKEMTSATRKPTPPTSVSMMVQVLRVVFSSMPTRLLTSQKPESLK